MCCIEQIKLASILNITVLFNLIMININKLKFLTFEPLFVKTEKESQRLSG